MNCPFCNAKLNDGELRCPVCGAHIVDFNYMKNLQDIEEKYSKRSLSELSAEKLTFSEIVTLMTFIERADRHAGDSSLSDRCSDDGTYSNLRKRLEEIRDESDK